MSRGNPNEIQTRKKRCFAALALKRQEDYIKEVKFLPPPTGIV
jgi:hypothetical protein